MASVLVANDPTGEAQNGPNPRVLNPLVSWVRFGRDSGGLQLRFPDGDHLTFDTHLDAIEQLLREWSGDQTNLLAAPVEDDVRDELVTLIDTRGGFITPATRPGGWLEAGFAYFQAQQRQIAPPGTTASPLRLVRVIGDGWLAGIVQDVLRDQLDIPSTIGACEGGDTQPDLIVLASDTDNLAFLRNHNQAIVERRQPAISMMMRGTHVLVGPHVVPFETPCFECYAERLLAGAPNPAEFAAYQDMLAQGVGTAPMVAEPNALATLGVRYIVGWHLKAISHGLFEFAEPGVRYVYDLVSMRTQESKTFRVPGCSSCGHHPDRPARAVRNLM
jgi:bacteriocin biosynthesis cyclodehydratase domain-containing protein